MKIATFIRKLEGSFTGDARLYKLSEPISDYGGNPTEYEYVIVSATIVYGYPETYIFGASSDGKVINWGELPGSFKYGLDHAEALRGAGYEIKS